MLSTQFNRDNQYQAITKPSLLAGCIALALLPSAAFAAPATEETVIVEGSATAPDDGENDYSVTSTSAGTKMQMTHVIFLSRSLLLASSGWKISSYKRWAK